MFLLLLSLMFFSSHFLLYHSMQNWEIIKNIINWEIIEDIIKKSLRVRLDEPTKIKGLKMLDERYGQELLEIPPDEIEKELIGYYIKELKGKTDAEEIELEDDEEDDFFEELEEKAQTHPELQYISQIVQMNPEFKKIIKKLRKASKEQEEKDDDRRNETMYI